MALDIQAIAFDKDGVIFDSERLYQTALEQTMAEIKVWLPPQLCARLRGLAAKESAELITQALPNTVDADVFITRWSENHRALMDKGALVFIPGVESLIETLYARGFPLALVTSDSMDNVLGDFQRTRPDLLHCFSVIVTVDDVNKPKPNPEPYLRAAALLGVENSQMLVIEDSDYGAQAAVASGAIVLLFLGKCDTKPAASDIVHATITQHQDVLDFVT